MNNTSLGLLLLRAFIGLRLMYGVFDNIISWEHMQRFADFLESYKFPLPIMSAVASVIAQFVCGTMLLLGFRVRIASAIMILNFLIALIVVHRNDTIEVMTPAAAILFSCACLLFTGSGRYALRED